MVVGCVYRIAGRRGPGQPGSVLHRSGRRAVPVRAGVPARAGQVQDASGLPAAGPPPEGGRVLPVVRPGRADDQGSGQLFDKNTHSHSTTIIHF